MSEVNVSGHEVSSSDSELEIEVQGEQFAVGKALNDSLTTNRTSKQLQYYHRKTKHIRKRSYQSYESQENPSRQLRYYHNNLKRSSVEISEPRSESIIDDEIHVDESLRNETENQEILSNEDTSSEDDDETSECSSSEVEDSTAESSETEDYLPITIEDPLYKGSVISRQCLRVF